MELTCLKDEMLNCIVVLIKEVFKLNLIRVNSSKSTGTSLHSVLW